MQLLVGIDVSLVFYDGRLYASLVFFSADCEGFMSRWYFLNMFLVAMTVFFIGKLKPEPCSSGSDITSKANPMYFDW